MKATIKLVSTLLVLTLAACSATIEGIADLKNGDVFAHKIQGPDLSGQWKSNCVLDQYDQKYHLKTFVISSNNVARTHNTYSDQACTVLLRKEEYSGIYRWLEVTSYGGYLVEYKFDVGNGVSILPKEELMLENGKLYLSDFVTGSGSISHAMPLVRIAQ